MPQILPLRGLRYTVAAGKLSDLVAPPYDVISAAQQEDLARRSPCNAVHLELAQGGGERYDAVAGLLRRWESGGIVAREAAPSLYVYEQEFSERGKRYVRRGLIAGVEAQPWEEGAVKPHEYTMSGPKADRLRLLETTRTQFSPVFMIARDRAGGLRDLLDTTIRAGQPGLSAQTPDGDDHRLWIVEAGRFELRGLAPLLSESFYIADGHHRYETAVAYKLALAAQGTLERDHPARFAMSAIVCLDDAGLIIRPIHRVVPREAPADWRARLGSTFDIEELTGAAAGQIDALLAADPRAIVAAGLEAGSIHSLRLKDAAEVMRRVPAGRSERWASVAPILVRYGILDPLWNISDDDLRLGAVEYTHETPQALAEAAKGACVFLLSPVSVGDVLALADRGERLPQKSTFFYPKLGTGLLFHPLYP